MIKFFRKIRYNLMETGKTGKYFKYAIGEIVLVVIGILIALSINNWNENRKLRIEERALLMQLQSEFISNLNQLDEKIAIRNDMISSSFKIFDYIDEPTKVNSDSLISYIVPTILEPTFDPIINDIISSGRIQLLKNAQLKELLSRWTSEIVQVTEEEIGWRTYKNMNKTFYGDYLSSRTYFNRYWQNNTMELFYLDKGTEVKFDLKNSKFPSNLSKLLEDPRFESYVASCASFSKIANIQSVSLRKRIVELLQLIEKELKESE